MFEPSVPAHLVVFHGKKYWFRHLNAASGMSAVARFGWVDYSALDGYLLVLIGVGIYFSRRESSTADYFRAGGRIPWWAASISKLSLQHAYRVDHFIGSNVWPGSQCPHFFSSFWRNPLRWSKRSGTPESGVDGRCGYERGVGGSFGARPFCR